MTEMLEPEGEELKVARVGAIYLLDGIEEISHYWDSIAQCLDATRPLWEDAFTKDSILARAIAGKIQIWVISRDGVLDLAFMTQAYRSDVRKVLQIFWMYGEGLREMLPLIALVLDQFATTIQAEVLEVTGRPAFVRLLAPLGGEFKAVTISRQVRTIARN